VTALSSLLKQCVSIVSVATSGATLVACCRCFNKHATIRLDKSGGSGMHCVEKTMRFVRCNGSDMSLCA